MNDDTKIKYTFHGEFGDVVSMTFTMIEIEGMHGGFMRHIEDLLEDMVFGKITKVYRMLLL